MKAKLDWKYLVMLLVTLVGIAPSFWTSRSDLSARAFKLDKISITALDQSTPPSVKGLKLFFENQQIKDSYLSVLELSNSGSKPILTAEFESPISVFFKESNKVLWAEVSFVSPTDLSPELTLVGNAVQLKPLLMNPADRVRITVLSIGGLPEFVPRSRIAGINEIQIEDRTLVLSRSLFWRQLILGVLLLYGYAYLMF